MRHGLPTDRGCSRPRAPELPLASTLFVRAVTDFRSVGSISQACRDEPQLTTLMET